MISRKIRQQRKRRGWGAEDLDLESYATMHGKRNPAAKLTAGQVAEIRRLAELGVSQRSLADAFGVSKRQVGRIIRREHWVEL